MARTSTRGLAALGTGLAAALLFAARAIAGPATVPTLPDPTVDQPAALPSGGQVIVFGGGCFWGVQAVFQHVKGVVSATSGYAGGVDKNNVTYEDVSTGTTGHAEVVQVVFDPAKVSLGQLLKVFFSVVHDPTELNRQGPDVGTQYRSAVYYTNDAQRQVVRSYVAQLTAAKAFKQPIVTEVAPLKKFYEAEAYHQNYYNTHPNQPYIVINDKPKVEALRTQFAELWR
jgi:peptide-methionine (S)-S-oxide reductase